MRERINDLRSDSRAVSPVIGVVLMIAVVVILAAVVGAFATGVFGSQQSAPQAAFSLDGDVVTMTSGDSIPSSALTVEVTSGGSTTESTFSDDPVTAGSSVDLAAGGTAPTAGSTIRIVWNPDDSDQSAVLFETTV